MQLSSMQSSSTEKPMATSKDPTDDMYEREYAEISDEVLHQLSQSESAEPHPTAATLSNSRPASATQPQTIGLMPPAVAADIQSGNGSEGLPENSSPVKSRRYRRQSSAPPAEITPTKLRPRITPSKKYDSNVAERANARRNPPKSTSPSPPIPSQILAMSLASSTSDPNPTNIATDDDPFQNSNVHPTLNHGPYHYGNQYPSQQMVSPYTASYAQIHGFPPMNTPQYGGQYDRQPNYGPLPGIQHGPLPGYPPHFQQSSNFHYFGVPGENPYPPPSRESTLARRDVTPSLPPHHYVASNSAHPSESNIPSNTSSEPKILTTETAPATAIQPEQSPNPLPKTTSIAPTSTASGPTPDKTPHVFATPRAGTESEPSKSACPDHFPATTFNDEDFIPLRIPPGPNDAPTLKVSPPTPISPTTPKRSLPTSDDLSTNYRLLLDNDSPTIGRLSKSKEDALIEGLGALDRLVKEIATSSGLSATQIVERWNGGSPRSLNSWNIYQTYIKENLDREIERLITIKKSKNVSADEIASIQRTLEEGSNFSSKVISDAYDGFQAAFPDRADKILHAWAQLNIMGSDKSFGQRAGIFRKQRDQFQTLAKQCADRYGFDFVGVLVGRVVNQDQALGAVIATEGATDFFPGRLKRSDDTILGHMKAHVYDYHSKLSEMDTSPVEPVSPSLTKKASAKPETLIKSNVSTKSEKDSVVDQLKEHLATLACTAGLKQSNQLPWKKLIIKLAEKGYVLWNYPEDVDFPCDDTKKKGFQGLGAKEQLALLDAFNHPTHPIKLVRTHTTSAIPINEPVIMGVPPPADSEFTHGRRKFLGKNKNEDRGGLPRLGTNVSDVISRDNGVSKKKESASKPKDPPPKRNARAKDKPSVSVSSSSEEDFLPDDDDDMYVSDVPKTGPKPAKEPLELPPFSTSPRATRSTRGKRQLPDPVVSVEDKKKKPRQVVHTDDEDDVPLTAISRGTSASENKPSSTKATAVKHAKPTKKTDLSSEEKVSEDIQVSPGTLSKRKNVADELFPVDEDSRHPKRSRQVPLSPQFQPSPAAPPLHQSYTHHPPSAPWLSAAPPNHPDGISGAVHGYHAGYHHLYPPPLPNGGQRNTDIHLPNPPIPPPHSSNTPNQQGFGGEYPTWRMPGNQYTYPERHTDLPNQHPYAERRPGPMGPMMYGHAGYDRLGPYHEPAYNHNPYGYSMGTHPPPPTSHTSHGSGGSLGANIPPGSVDKHPSTNANIPESSAEDGRTKEMKRNCD